MPIPPCLDIAAQRLYKYKQIKNIGSWHDARTKYQSEIIGRVTDQGRVEDFFVARLQVDIVAISGGNPQFDFDHLLYHYYVPGSERDRQWYNFADSLMQKEWIANSPKHYLSVNDSIQYTPILGVDKSCTDRLVPIYVKRTMNWPQFRNIMPLLETQHKPLCSKLWKEHYFTCYEENRPLGSSHARTQPDWSFRPSAVNKDPENDLIPSSETPPGTGGWAFDLTKVHDQKYRHWFMQQNQDGMVTHYWKKNGEDGLYTADNTIWYKVCDMLAFYGNRAVGAKQQNQETYMQLQLTNRRLHRLMEKCREMNQIRVYNEEDYITQGNFDEIFLKWIPNSIFAKKIYARLRPLEAANLVLNAATPVPACAETIRRKVIPVNSPPSKQTMFQVLKETQS